MPLPDPRQVRDLVEAAMAIDPLSRRTFILNACHGDEALSDEALRLLEEVSSIGTTLVAPPRADLTYGSFAGTARFTVVRRLGAGGFGTVYEALDRNANRPVAIKVLRRLEFLDRFKREFRALADLRHETLVPLYELFAEPTWFFTMELVRGVNIIDYVAPHPADPSTPPVCDIGRLRAVTAQLVSGIRALHANGILHRDIKPSNILVTDDGRLQLLDFGLIWEVERSAVDSAIWAGTPGYLAPELLSQSPATTASDWYSFGVVLYQCLVGVTPPADLLRLVDRFSRAEVSFPEHVPDDLKRLCTELLRSDPEKRPTETEIADCLVPAAAPARRATTTLHHAARPIGRESQLGRLHELFTEVCRGRTVVVNVHGNSGVGKTTLLRAFAQTVRSDFDAVLLSGRCHQNETVPYKALDDLVDGVARYLKSLRGADVEAFTPHDVAYLGRLFPSLARVEGLHHVRPKAVDVVDVQELRERAFSSLHDLLVRLSEKRVVVITLDDLQWGDLDSAAFLNKLLAGPAPPSMLFIASYRSEDEDTSPFLQQWRASLLAASRVRVADVAVTPLDRIDATRVASELLTGVRGATSEWVETIAVESGGSPFLIDQMARHLAVGGSQTVTHLGDAIAQQVSQLPHEVQRLLECVSIAGEPLPSAVVNAAAGLERESIVQLSHLTSERLIRIREARGAREVEAYHDRIGETIAAGLDPDRRRARHLALAEALHREAYPNAALLATHFRAGGNAEAASRWSIAAADQSMQALAFDRAAHWYAAALDLRTLTGDREVAVRAQLAHALVHAGHGARAAATYLQAAQDASATERFEFKRLAAEQLLRAGLITRGLDLLQSVARDAGVWLPMNRWQMIVSILWQRAKVKLRGLTFQIRSRDAIAPADIVTLDVYWSLLIGFSTLDSTRSLDFQARHLLLALRVGDTDRIAMALAAEGAFNASFKSRQPHVVAGLFERARQLTERTTHPQAAGLVATFDALSAFISGEFTTAQRLALEARTVLRERCSGVKWESATATMVYATSSIHLGDWRKFEDPSTTLSRMSDAAEQNNAHEIYAVSSGMHISTLVSDRVDLGRAIGEKLKESLAASPKDQYLLPHLWLLEGNADIALYQQDPPTAWALVESDWPAFSRSSHHWLEYAAICAYHLRARTAIAMAAVAENPRAYSRHATTCLRRLERHRVSWARTFAAMVRAGLASLAGDPQVVALLETAEQHARVASMRHCEAACRYRRGKLIGGVHGAQLVADAERWTNEQAIVRPDRMFDVFLPGRWA